MQTLSKTTENLSRIVSSFLGGDKVKIGIVGCGFRSSKDTFRSLVESLPISGPSYHEVDVWYAQIDNITLNAVPANGEIRGERFDVLIISDNIVREEMNNVIATIDAIKIYLPDSP